MNKPKVRIQIGDDFDIQVTPEKVITMTPAAAAYWHVFTPETPKHGRIVVEARKQKP